MKLFLIYFLKFYFNFNRTVLHIAVIHKNAKIVDMLLSHNGIDTDSKDAILH